MPRSPFSRSPRHSQEATIPQSLRQSLEPPLPPLPPQSYNPSASRPAGPAPLLTNDPLLPVPSHGHSHSHSTQLPTTRRFETSPPPQDVRRSSSLAGEFRGMRRLEQRRNMEENHYLACKARAQNYNPPVDLRLLDYVMPYDNNLMCPICRCPFVDPVVLTECDHCFCRDCIRQTWNTRSTYSPLGPRGDCPSCRTPAKLGPRSATSKILVNIVDDLLVKCPKSDDGCKAQVKRGEIKDHINIYCGYALVECPGSDCDLPVLRKDSSQGCLHHGASCLSCKREVQVWKLGTHWRNECPDRTVHCDLCKSAVLYRELDEHTRQTCPATSIPCPGKAFGCTSRGKRGQAEVHAKTCVFAKLAPLLSKQQERLDEQEAAQKQMSRKLEVLEDGFASMQGLLYPKHPDRSSADSNSIPGLSGPLSSEDTSLAPMSPRVIDFPPVPSAVPSDSLSEPAEETLHNAPNIPHPQRPAPPIPATEDMIFPPPAPHGGPYASPLHHLLSLHENLRSELSRMAAALSELDGRHSLQALNENLRTREEISYLGAQVGGVQRQVHWLTSVQLQRQQGSPGPSGSAAGAAGGSSAAAGVEAAVSTAATALRGAARVVNVGAGSAGAGGMRRRASEEGRTKL